MSNYSKIIPNFSRYNQQTEISLSVLHFSKVSQMFSIHMDEEYICHTVDRLLKLNSTRKKNELLFLKKNQSFCFSFSFLIKVPKL